MHYSDNNVGSKVADYSHIYNGTHDYESTFPESINPGSIFSEISENRLVFFLVEFSHFNI